MSQLDKLLTNVFFDHFRLATPGTSFIYIIDTRPAVNAMVNKVSRPLLQFNMLTSLTKNQTGFYTSTVSFTDLGKLNLVAVQTS